MLNKTPLETPTATPKAPSPRVLMSTQEKLRRRGPSIRVPEPSGICVSRSSTPRIVFGGRQGTLKTAGRHRANTSAPLVALVLASAAAAAACFSLRSPVLGSEPKLVARPRVAPRCRSSIQAGSACGAVR